YENAATLTSGFAAAAETTVDRLATFAVTVWACEVIVSSRANWRFTPSSDVCTWVSAPFTLSTVTLARISNGPTWSATLSRARVAGGSEPVGVGIGWEAFGSGADDEVPGAGATLARSHGASRVHRSSTYSSRCQQLYTPARLGQPAECQGCQPARVSARSYTGSVSAAGFTERQVRSRSRQVSTHHRLPLARSTWLCRAQPGSVR